MSNIRHCQTHGEYHESETGCPHCEDEQRMAAGFGAALALTEEAASEIVCSWSEDEGGNWNTGCDNFFIINEGTPSENKMAFCCYCGKPLEQVLYVEEIDND